MARSTEVDRREVQNALEAERSQAIQAQLLQEQKTNRLQKMLLAIVSFSALIFAGIGGVAQLSLLSREELDIFERK